MKLLLVISALTTISAIRVPNIWQQQQQQLQQPNSERNNANTDIPPIRREENLAQPVPNYNNVNRFVNNVPNPAAPGLIGNGNLFQSLPADYNNWFTSGTPSNGFRFISPSSRINSGSLLGNNINQLLNNGNNIRRKPYVQSGPPRLVQAQRNFNRRPPTPNNFDQESYNDGRGQVPYITYTTQGPPPQSASFERPRTDQNSGQPNIKQAYPQVTSPKTVIPLTELDFSPQRPFAQNQQIGRPSNQINNQNYVYSTSQPVRNLDFNLNDPFPVSDFQITQLPQATRFTANKPSTLLTNGRKPQYNPTAALRSLDFNPFIKNYRDHRTHEPTQYDPNYDKEAVPRVERLESERAPVVKNHEHPEEVPTRPIYPGEGQWAKPGRKHRPFVSNQQYSNLEESNERPDGYDVFLEGQKLFEGQKRQFGQKIEESPSNTDTPAQQSSTIENSDGEIFVPTRLYAQVRHSEDEKHLPPESDENGRLKELIKDTKIQTIYSEEGFEDSAYDHAGHEKKAENNEDFESDEKNEELKDKKVIPLKKYNRESASYSVGDQNLKEGDVEKLKKEALNLENETTESNDDSESAGTHYERSYLNKILPTKNKDAFIKSKEIKTVTAKGKGGGKIEMEISSEVKAVVQPNNSTKIHKYVKIYPKISDRIATENDITDDDNVTSPSKKQMDAERRSLYVDPHDIFIEEITNHTSDRSSTEYISTTAPPTEYTEIVSMEIPTTTQATTAIPKLEFDGETEGIKNINKAALRLKLKRRRKRSVPENPTIEVDTDFIDKINHDIGKPTEKSNKPDEKKYPYYKQYKEKGLHEDSPLRYSENLKNVPVKTEGKLAFYDLADKKMACSDVNPEVDPVPDRIQNADESVEEEEEDEEGNDPATKAPRLGQLGDKIDCFKAKYFGDNPLDNPFFEEKSVGTLKPIFSEIEQISTKKIGGNSVDNINTAFNAKSTKREIKNIHKEKEPLYVAASSHDSENEIKDGKRYKFRLTSWFPGKNFGIGENTERDSKFVNHFVEKNPHLKSEVQPQQSGKISDDNDSIKAQNSKNSAKEIQTPPPATLITTPRYTIELKPKHIYDQIQLLQYLPEEEIAEIRKEINEHLPKTNLTGIVTPSPNPNKLETVLNKPLTKKKKKKSGKKGSERKAKAFKDAEESMKMETSDDREPESLPESDALQLLRPKPKKPLYEIFDINKFLPKVQKISFPPAIISTDNPNKFAPIAIVNPTYKVFDINKYLPTTPFPLFKDFITQSTVLPKYKVISEVFYKEDIKPNEQFNVFTDILNNIRNFPSMKDNFPEPSEPIAVKLDPDHKPQTEKTDKDYFSSTTTTLMTTFNPKAYASNHKYLQAEDPEKQIESMLKNYKPSNKPKRRRRIKSTTQETPMVIEESTSTLRVIGEPTEVIGLMPPLVQGYKTIYHQKRDNNQQISNPSIRIEERKINKYFVQGMKPPPKQQIYLYSDFLTDNHIQRSGKPKKSKLRRSRRSAQRPAYAQVSRSKNKSPDAETQTKKEDDDDYVPHRPRNYHYDEKTGKIVYDKKPEASSEEEEDVEYIEVVPETPKTTEKPKQNVIFATATPPPKGQSYTDFVKLLKSASNYHEIPDPTTTEKGAEKGAEEVTQKMAESTLHSISTSPPEFLSILAKVRNDSSYKLIEEKKKTTTTSKPEEETENVEEESQVEDIRNSPGGHGYDAGINLEIFDITDFLPNIKSYLPKTSIDTSKYKTIERPQLRHRLSSRYNSEEEKDLQNVNTSKQPILSNNERPVTRRNGQERIKEQVRKPSTVYTTTTPVPEVTTIKTARSPIRIRTTTATTLSAQNDESTTLASLSTNESAAATTNTDKTRRRRRRRRRPKRVKATPASDDNLEAPIDNTTQAIHRRAERESHMLAVGNEKFEQIVENDTDIPLPLIQMEDYVDYEEVTDNINNTNTDTEQLKDITKVAKEVVDVFKNYDKNKKHGGNYKKEDEVNKANLQQNSTALPEKEKSKLKASVDVIKPYDKTKKHGGNYKAEKEDIVKPKENVKPIPTKPELKDAKKAEVFKEYDKTKKHGGNYRPANDDFNINEDDESGLEKRESIQIENVNVFQDYDKTKKHGGNYKAEKGVSDAEKANIELEKPTLQKNVEVFKDYDKTKKHGGNYKSENNVPEQQSEESQFGSPQSRQNVLNAEAKKSGSVDVFKNYDKTKKHGGNYARENESNDKENAPVKQQSLIDKGKDVDVFKSYDETKKTGGNYKSEEEADQTNADETRFSKSKVPQQKRYVENRNGIQRLADVAVKPEMIYSDLNLPLDINALNIVKNLTNEELEEIVDSAEVDTDAETDKDDIFRKEDSVTPVVSIGNKIKTAPVVEAPITTTKQPLFIKDPNKRLYYYAPVR